MKSKLFFFLLIIYAMFSNYSAQENNETLQTLIQKAVEVSPKLKMLEAKKNASEARVSANSNLPDPTLTLGLMNLPTNSFSFTQEPMTGKMIGLSQAVPYPGKLGAAENVLNKDAEITQEEIDDAKNEIINNIKQAYYDLSFARSALGIAEKSKSNLERISAVVRTKYTVSEASQQNLIQADVELTKIKDKIAELKGKVSSSLSTLNSYLLQNRDTQIETENLSAINSVVLNINELNKTAKQNRPFLKGIELEKNKSELMENLADYEYYPNFNFSVQYSQRDKITATNTPLNDFVSFVVGLNLPINYGGKKSAKVQESRIMQKMYANQYDAALQVLNKNFGEALSKIDELKEREKLNS
ncbi:MAG: TolC family protein, partial [Ignavibacteriae bacterium]|nr:TolC family protein [Ignavibacteriota bacterium]